MSTIATTAMPLAALDRLAKNVLEAVIEVYQPELNEDNTPLTLVEAWCEYLLASTAGPAIEVPKAFNDVFVPTVRRAVLECATRGYLTRKTARQVAKVFSDLPFRAITDELAAEPVYQQFNLLMR